ncbi:hypothetical protein FXF65_37715 [Actinomadura syzygii]|uniref:Lantibiotic dehydratase N-terminal domain-containing protein n=2 Tax=Actinomadura syzygii TaxID=1427538 RepID=A0A5D0TTH8_9ACTN|nr:hypothetical protein [Actinomadura syzygii]TYC08632.1 hypothetical protein FXF65_37715 [Actinomadura syzygii]
MASPVLAARVDHLMAIGDVSERRLRRAVASLVSYLLGWERRATRALPALLPHSTARGFPALDPITRYSHNVSWPHPPTEPPAPATPPHDNTTGPRPSHRA